METFFKISRLIFALILGCISGWLSSRAYTDTYLYMEPVPIFLGFATLLMLPDLLKGKLLPWLGVCLSSFVIYFVVLFTLVPFITMSVGSILFLTAFYLFFRIKRHALVVTLSMSLLQLIAGIVITNDLLWSLPRELDSSANVIDFTNAGFPVFVWQVLAMVSIAWFQILPRDADGKFLE